MKEENISRKEFDDEFRKAMHIIYKKQIEEGKIYETETGWYGIKFKK